MFDGIATKVHKPLPQPTLDKQPPSDVATYHMDVEAYLRDKYPTLPKPEGRRGVVIEITEEQRRNALANRRK